MNRRGFPIGGFARIPFPVLAMAASLAFAEADPWGLEGGGAAPDPVDSSLIIKSHDVQEDWDGERRRKAEQAAAKEARAPEIGKATDLAAEEAVRTDTRPALSLLPWVAPEGAPGDRAKWEKAAAAVRLGLAQSGKFRVWTEEEAARNYGIGEPLPRGCFSEGCMAAAAGKSAGAFVVACRFAPRDSVLVLKLVLAETPTGKIRRAVQVWGNPGEAGLLPFAREAAARLAAASEVPDGMKVPGMPDGPGGIEGTDGTGVPDGNEKPMEPPPRADRSAGIAGTLYAAQPWRTIPWLNPRDTVDNRVQWRWAGSGLLLAGLGLAWAQGQLLQEDGNDRGRPPGMLSGGGGSSFLRGFFASPTLGARYAAMGGAGIAEVGNGLSLLMNPAGVADIDRENAVAAKRSLPGGVPSLFMAYAGPLYRGWGQGLGVQFEGDRLANETTLHGALACDLGLLGKAWEGMRAGSQLKLYLAQVGEGGAGLDRSTGHSFGMGLDLGMRARLNAKITAALTVRDALGFLRHANTLTDRAYGEILPPEYRVGATYRASSDLLLHMDGQKGLRFDQADHLRLGGERTVFGVLALRCGLHETFGRESVRKISAGFGIDTEGLGDKALFGSRVSLNYAYEFGLKEDGPLAAGQQFSLEAGF